MPSSNFSGGAAALQSEAQLDRVLEFARSVAKGLSMPQKGLDCRYLYDSRGSELFEQICAQPEYYLTDAEASILEQHSDAIIELTGRASLLELGAGASVKTEHLLRACVNAHGSAVYAPVDVSFGALAGACDRIGAAFPEVTISPFHGRYEEAFPLLHDLRPVLALFLGSTIGNFPEIAFDRFWRSMQADLRSGDHFLLGADLHKDTATLEAAYNDAAGVTAQFTLNLFTRINTELGASIDLDAVEHVAYYNEALRQIEIFAEFTRAQDIYVAPLERTFRLEAGERIHTEVSRKFDTDELRNWLGRYGFDTREVYLDDRGLFASLLLRRR